MIRRPGGKAFTRNTKASPSLGQTPKKTWHRGSHYEWNGARSQGTQLGICPVFWDWHGHPGMCHEHLLGAHWTAGAEPDTAATNAATRCHSFRRPAAGFRKPFSLAWQLSRLPLWLTGGVKLHGQRIQTSAQRSGKKADSQPSQSKPQVERELWSTSSSTCSFFREGLLEEYAQLQPLVSSGSGSFLKHADNLL